MRFERFFRCYRRALALFALLLLLFALIWSAAELLEEYGGAAGVLRAVTAGGG
ncbi:MAG: hypothetical protein IJU52_08675 [Clostridia bacterium]|nr:hypothetical protein [Clostridia bacterium]